MSPFWRCLREMRWGPTTSVYCDGAVFSQREVWPVGKVGIRRVRRGEAERGLWGR